MRQFVLLVATIFLLKGILTQGDVCNNIPAGLNRLALGVDITILSLEPLDFNQPDGYAGPVIDLTCNEGKVWKNPYDQKVYQLPDQVWSMVSVPDSWLNAVTKIYKSYSDVKNEMSANAGVGLISGMFSSSASYKSMNEAISNKSEEISDVFSFVSTTQAVFAPAIILGLNHYGQIFVDNLPENFTESPSDYYDFISVFGTHYFGKGKFGGYIRNYFETSSEYYLTHSEHDIQVQATGSFFNLLKADGGYDGSTFEVDEEFSKNTNSFVIYYGGDTNLLQADGLPKWQPTVPENPWIFGGSLIPIYEMINVTKKQDSMKQAVQAHLDKAYLGELSRLLQSALIRYEWGNTTVIKSLQVQVNQELDKVIPDHEVVTQLGDAVNFQLTPDSWWREIQFCYRYYADGDGGQCTGPASPLCANPDEYTVYYRDDTDGRGGGCQMSWGVMAPDFVDTWFNKVQVCYRYYPDGDGGQCGSGKSATLCAPINSYTAYYRDDTDNRGGGCQMSWQLSVPLDAPVWLLNTQLCYNWYPDGDGGQCGGGAKQLLCAIANQWTSYYRDDSDNRGGGCQMRWSIKDSLVSS